MAWIGASFYFIALDNHLEPPRDPDDMQARRERRGVGDARRRLLPRREVRARAGAAARTAALVQVGGVHDVALGVRALHRRLLLARDLVPDRPVGGRSDGRGRRSRSRSQGSRSRGSSTTGCAARSRNDEALLAVLVFAFVCLSAWGAWNLFAARAAYLQVGAMIGTMMVGNVFFVIIPNHWKLVRAKEAGREPDPRWNRDGKTRSVHNNYLTLPVVFAMLSNHFTFTYGHSQRLDRARRADGDRRARPALLQPASPRAERLADPRARGCRDRHDRAGHALTRYVTCVTPGEETTRAISSPAVTSPKRRTPPPSNTGTR